MRTIDNAMDNNSDMNWKLRKYRDFGFRDKAPALSIEITWSEPALGNIEAPFYVQDPNG